MGKLKARLRKQIGWERENGKWERPVTWMKREKVWAILRKRERKVERLLEIWYSKMKEKVPLIANKSQMRVCGENKKNRDKKKIDWKWERERCRSLVPLIKNSAGDYIITHHLKKVLPKKKLLSFELFEKIVLLLYTLVLTWTYVCSIEVI